MIDTVTGQIAKLDKDSVVIVVGGIGLRILVPKSVFDIADGPGRTLTLYTYLAVREDALTLYGFSSEDERTLFETLISVSGVGPKIGLAILGTLTPDHLRNAVMREEPAILTRVPGIGKTTAEKIVFELKGKLGAQVGAGLAAFSDSDGDVIAALTALGYSVIEAQSALQSLPRDAPKDVETRIVMALQYFS
jgi:holliday junction DNA helicase RuvA